MTLLEQLKAAQAARAAHNESEDDQDFIDAECEPVSHVERMQNGPDATLQVGTWTRKAAREEADSGGLFGELPERYEAGAWPSFVRDLFASLYGVDAAPIETPAEGTEWITKVLDQARALPDWKRLARHAQGEAWVSGLSSAKMTDALKEVLDEVLADAPEADPIEAKQMREQQRQALLDAQHDLDAANAGGELDADEIEALEQDVSNLAAAEDAASRIAAESLAWADLAAKQVASLEVDVRKALRKAMAAAIGEVAAVEEAVAGFMPGSGTFYGGATVPREQLIELLRKDMRLCRIAKVAGRMKVSMRRVQAAKTRHYQDEIYSVENGDDVRRLLPSEIGLLGDPDTELLLDAKLVERSAAVYALRGKEKLDRGPIVVLIDASGSMTHAVGGVSRQEWACGVALALIELASKQRRPWCVAHYQGQVTQFVTLPKGVRPTTADLIKAVTAHTGGGTTLGNALAWVSKTMPLGKDADVVAVSDGDDHGFADAMDDLKKQGVRVYAIEIESRFPEPERSGFTECSSVNLTGGNDNVDAVLAI